MRARRRQDDCRRSCRQRRPVRRAPPAAGRRHLLFQRARRNLIGAVKRAAQHAVRRALREHLNTHGQEALLQHLRGLTPLQRHRHRLIMHTSHFAHIGLYDLKYVSPVAGGAHTHTRAMLARESTQPAPAFSDPRAMAMCQRLTTLGQRRLSAVYRGSARRSARARRTAAEGQKTSRPRRRRVPCRRSPSPLCWSVLRVRVG